MKNSFLSGAIILMAANAVSKVLGAVLKIPLTYIIHEEGMAVYNTAFSVYVMFLSFVISGMPFAVQKLTAAACAVGDRKKARRIVCLATGILSAVGLAGTAVLWFGADFFAFAMKEERAGWAIRAIAPSVFLVALGTAVKSGFQGESDMVPTAVSQVIEAFIKLGAGYFFALVCIGYGTEFAAAGAGAGVTAGELAATVMLGIWYLLTHRGMKRMPSREPGRKIAGELMEIALPLLFMSVVGSSLSVCDTSVLRMSLIRSGLSAEEARFVYGSYTGYAMTVLNLPSGLLATLGVSIVPVISGAAAVGNRARVLEMSARAILLSAVCGIAAVGGLWLWGEDVLKLLFRNTNSAPMLRLAAPSVAFICVMQITGAVLQSMGCIWSTFAASAVTGVIKLCFSAFLASQPGINIYGAILGTDAAFFAGMMLNLLFLSRCLRKMQQCDEKTIENARIL